jgi:hypothetical protein
MTQRIAPTILKRRCDQLLVALLGGQELVERWWASPNLAFGNKTPAEVFETAPEIVYNYLCVHAYGGW